MHLLKVFVRKTNISNTTAQHCLHNVNDPLMEWTHPHFCLSATQSWWNRSTPHLHLVHWRWQSIVKTVGSHWWLVPNQLGWAWKQWRVHCENNWFVVELELRYKLMFAVQHCRQLLQVKLHAGDRKDVVIKDKIVLALTCGKRTCCKLSCSYRK